MTTCISLWSIRLKWHSQHWSGVSSRRLSNSIPTLLRGITRASCGRRVTLLPHAAEHRYPSFVCTLKINGKICECCALNLLYPCPERRGFTRSPINVLDIVQAAKADHLQAVCFQVRFAFEARILSVRN